MSCRSNAKQISNADLRVQAAASSMEARLLQDGCLAYPAELFQTSSNQDPEDFYDGTDSFIADESPISVRIEACSHVSRQSLWDRLQLSLSPDQRSFDYEIIVAASQFSGAANCSTQEGPTTPSFSTPIEEQRHQETNVLAPIFLSESEMLPSSLDEEQCSDNCVDAFSSANAFAELETVPSSLAEESRGGNADIISASALEDPYMLFGHRTPSTSMCEEQHINVESVSSAMDLQTMRDRSMSPGDCQQSANYHPQAIIDEIADDSTHSTSSDKSLSMVSSYIVPESEMKPSELDGESSPAHTKRSLPSGSHASVFALDFGSTPVSMIGESGTPLPLHGATATFGGHPLTTSTPGRFSETESEITTPCENHVQETEPAITVSMVPSKRKCPASAFVVDNELQSGSSPLVRDVVSKLRKMKTNMFCSVALPQSKCLGDLGNHNFTLASSEDAPRPDTIDGLGKACGTFMQQPWKTAALLGIAKNVEQQMPQKLDLGGDRSRTSVGTATLKSSILHHVIRTSLLNSSQDAGEEDIRHRLAVAAQLMLRKTCSQVENADDTCLSREAHEAVPSLLTRLGSRRSLIAQSLHRT